MITSLPLASSAPRAKCELSADQVRGFFREARMTDGPVRSQFVGLSDEQFMQRFQLLMVLLLKATPRVNPGIVTDALKAEYGPGSNANINLSLIHI